jgi:hypothetical protein
MPVVNAGVGDRDDLALALEGERNAGVPHRLDPQPLSREVVVQLRRHVHLDPIDPLHQSADLTEERALLRQVEADLRAPRAAHRDLLVPQPVEEFVERLGRAHEDVERGNRDVTRRQAAHGLKHRNLRRGGAQRLGGTREEWKLVDECNLVGRHSDLDGEPGQGLEDLDPQPIETLTCRWHEGPSKP